MNRISSFLFAVVVMFATLGNINTVTAAIAKKGEALTITTTELPKGEDNVVYKAKIEVKGGTAPYAFKVKADFATDINGDGVIRFTPTPDSPRFFTVIVTDADNKTAEREFTIEVAAHTETANEIVSRAREGLATPGDITKAVNKALEKVATQEQLKTSVEGVDRWQLGVIAIIVSGFAFVLAVIAVLIAKKNGRVVAPVVALLFVVLSSPSFSATVASITPPSMKVGEAGVVKVCGSGLDKLEDAKFDGLVHTKLEEEKGCLEFTMDVKSTATKGDFKFMTKETKTASFVDSGKVFKVVDSTTPPSATPAVSSSHVENMRWKALFNAVCGVGVGNGKCGKEYGKSLTGDDLFKQLLAAKTQQQEDAVLAQLVLANEVSSMERTFGEKRFTDVTASLKAMNKAVLAMNDTVSGMSDGTSEFRVREIAGEVFEEKIVPVTRRLEEVSRVADEAKGIAKKSLHLSMVTYEGTNAMLTATVTGKKLSRKSATTLNQRLACAHHLAAHGTVMSGCETK